MSRVLVEGFDRDAVVLARLLVREGRRVTLAGLGDASQQALELRASGVAVRARASLDTEPGPFDEAFLDPRTPEVAPRVALLRQGGCVVRCLADLVLERSEAPTIGVTGTAGKTTTAAFLSYLLRSAGVTVHTSTAQAANLWPTAELVPPPADGVVLMELTSSHLCFTTHSPNLAVITCFWPDHLELHGSLERYRSAKEAIVGRQGAEDVVVANEDDADAAAIADLSAGRRFGFSAKGEVELGAFVQGRSFVVRDAAGERSFRIPPRLDAPRRQALLAAAATALAVGVLPERLGAPERQPPHRATHVGQLGETELVDDGLAATPSKTAAALHGHRDGSVVLVCGGELESAGLPVHASPEEQRLLEEACAEARAVARLVVLFGPAAARLAPFFDRTRTLHAATLDEAIELASSRAEGAEVLVVSPMFPLPLADRERIAPALEHLAGATASSA
jgi:UDP-N-acetylmuramoylalanine--D-glutamate ligase